MTLKPVYWQIRKARQLWPDTAYYKIALACKCSRETLCKWRDKGYLDPLPERGNIAALAQLGNTNGSGNKKAEKVKSAPLTRERLCTTRDCEKCKYILVCDLWSRTGFWCGCELATEEEAEQARKMGVLGKVFHV